MTMKNNDNELVRQAARKVAKDFHGKVKRVYATRDNRGQYVIKVTPVLLVSLTLPPTIIVRPGLVVRIEAVTVAPPKMEMPKAATTRSQWKDIPKNAKREKRAKRPAPKLPQIPSPTIPRPVTPEGQGAKRPFPQNRRSAVRDVPPPRSTGRPPSSALLPVLAPKPGTTSGPKDPFKSDYGNRPELAQTWCPDWLRDIFWQGMESVGFSPKTHRRVYDLAAGTGRLLPDEIKQNTVLLLNDIDPDLVLGLKKNFGPPHRVYGSDFRKMGHLPKTTCMIGSPPWIDMGGEYLPQAYVKLAEKLLAPGGILGIVVPEEFRPRTNLALLKEVELSSARKRRIAHWREMPVLLYYVKK